ncbi:hypothetical protein ACQ4M3_25285 [Leptolyngbya sp. AN03gr2]|uniref:hypothetical protein n=1 Tax=unclassified Leptolyngbya TaxID=2650499 RepID=UPI003D31A735
MSKDRGAPKSAKIIAVAVKLESGKALDSSSVPVADPQIRINTIQTAWSSFMQKKRRNRTLEKAII